jgi:O-antigen ligase
MRALFNINDSLSNKISYYHLLLLLFSLPFDMFYSHLILISFGIHTLLHVKKDKLRSIFKWRTLVLQSVFWVTLIGITYSPSRDVGFTDLGRQAVIVLVPVLFSLTSLDFKKYRNNLLLGFSLCCTLTVAYLYVEALHTMRYYGYPFKMLFSAAFTNHNFSDPIEMHATFFSFQVGLSLIYLLTMLIKQTVVNRKLFYGFCCLLLALGLIQLSSKSVCAAILLSIAFVVPAYILSGRARVKFVVAGIFLTLVSGLILFQSSALKERFFTALKEDISQASPDEVVDPRLARWSVATDLISYSPVIGYGSGTELSLLKEQFFNHRLYSSYINNLNAHNEYLSFLLNTGMVGLLIYLITLGYGLKRAIDQRNVVFISFMLLVIIVSVSENVLDVDKGTIFYGLFFSLFIFAEKDSAASRAQKLFN